MDWEQCHRHWSALVSTLMLHGKKIGVVAAGILVIGVAYGLMTSVSRKPLLVCESAKTDLVTTSDTCPWQFVMSDLAHRLRLIEMAFKEQVIAREIIAAEVTNQSYSNLELERKLDNFTNTIRQLSAKIDKLGVKVSELTSRLYSDECLGFLVLVFVAGQVILTLRAKLNIKHGIESAHHQSRHGSHDLSNQNGSSCSVVKNLTMLNSSGSQVPLKPTSSYIRQDVCVIGLDKFAWKINAEMAETLVKCATEDVAAAHASLKSCYVIESADSMTGCPRAKLYIIIVDCSVDSGGETCSVADSQQMIRLIMALGYLRSTGGHVFVVLINESDSTNLPAHCLYNTRLPLIQNNDPLQELASSGRVLSLWKELSPNQLSHIRKAARSLLSFKGK